MTALEGMIIPSSKGRSHPHIFPLFFVNHRTVFNLLMYEKMLQRISKNVEGCRHESSVFINSFSGLECLWSARNERCE